jgi:hypothetical protein
MIIRIQRILAFAFVVIMISTAVEAQPSRKGIFGKSRNKTEANSKIARNPGKAKRMQEAKLRKQKRDYGKFVESSRKRSIEIQTPEVQTRMKQNNKNAEANYKMKKKKTASKSRKAGRKYR